MYTEFYEATVPEGLERIAIEELRHKYGKDLILMGADSEQHAGTVQFDYYGMWVNLLQLKTVVSLFKVIRIPVPRPRALLGHQHFHALFEQIQVILRHYPANMFQTLYLAAAGSETSVMQRFAQEMASQVGLRVHPQEGDLLLRVRRPLNGGDGWEVLIRMTPRPFSARHWRVCDYPGALNAAVARAMVIMTIPRREDRVLNLACGSGSILAERESAGPYQMAIGCDTDPYALTCARTNLAAARSSIQVYPWDARHLPLADQSFDVICADLPFGHIIGSHEENLLLYPHLIKEAARVAQIGARIVFLTHEIRLMESILERSLDFDLDANIPLTLKGLHPHIYCLTRVTST